ncbi:hypothetical protein EDD21DRAFT_380016 [Dissophora ornata]|nr:hypothetical protein BGZ58_002468 [Dissophora ornata]KAI8599392.1 hypothetical protein EDD21DRAFT_380016 [Dissophora ornata]
MKFLAVAIAAASVAAVANAQAIQINNPTDGTVWTAGSSGYISWTSNCAAMGNSSRAVDIQLIDGPSTAVRFVADLGNLDCSGNTTSLTITVPTTVATGSYSLRVLTLPTNSYSTTFQINNAAIASSSAVATATTTTAAPAATTKASAGNSLVAGSLATLAGCAVAALQLVL